MGGSLEELEKKVSRRRLDLQRTQGEKSHLKWVLLVASILTVVAFFWKWLAALAVLVAGLLFYGTGIYINWWHQREAQARLEDAEREYQRHAPNAQGK